MILLDLFYLTNPLIYPSPQLDHKKRLDKLGLNLVKSKICPTDLPNVGDYGKGGYPRARTNVCVLLGLGEFKSPVLRVFGALFSLYKLSIKGRVVF